MLSQRVNLLLCKWPNSLVDNTDLIRQSILKWEAAHNGLLFGNDKMTLKELANENIKEKLHAAGTVITLVKKQLNTSNPITKEKLKYIDERLELFLPLMDSVVNELQYEAQKKLNHIVYKLIYT